MRETSLIPYARASPVMVVTPLPVARDMTLAAKHPSQEQVRHGLPALEDARNMPVPLDSGISTKADSGGAKLVAVPHTDRIAVASAVCGLAAFVPVFSQIAGLTLGIVSLFRIRRARRAGVLVRGTGWATMGIASSAFALLLWLGTIVAYAAVGSSLTRTTNAFQPLLHGTPSSHLRIRR